MPNPHVSPACKLHAFLTVQHLEKRYDAPKDKDVSNNDHTSNATSGAPCRTRCSSPSCYFLVTLSSMVSQTAPTRQAAITKEHKLWSIRRQLRHHATVSSFQNLPAPCIIYCTKIRGCLKMPSSIQHVLKRYALVNRFDALTTTLLATQHVFPSTERLTSRSYTRSPISVLRRMSTVTGES